MSRFARKERPPPGFEVLEPTLNALENELRESELLSRNPLGSPSRALLMLLYSATACVILLTHAVLKLCQGGPPILVM